MGSIEHYVKLPSCVLGLIVMAFASGCATIVEGTDQTVTIMTDPTGATCRLERDGSTIGIVNATPGSVNPITIAAFDMGETSISSI